MLEARVTSRWYGLPIARDCYLPPANGFRSYPSSVVPQPCLHQLPLDILLYLLYILPCCVYVVLQTPIFLIPIFIFQLQVLFVDHQTAFSLEISHETRYRNLRRDFHQHMLLVRAHLCLYHLYFFQLHSILSISPILPPFFPIKYFPTVFWHEYNMIFAISSRMR